MNLSDMEHSAYKAFIISRIEVSLQRLKDNPEYQDFCRQQDAKATLLMNCFTSWIKMTVSPYNATMRAR